MSFVGPPQNPGSGPVPFGGPSKTVHFATVEEVKMHSFCICKSESTPRRFLRRDERGGFRGLNPGPLAPKARIIPLDQIPGMKLSDVDVRPPEVLGGFEPPSLDSKSRVITATL